MWRRLLQDHDATRALARVDEVAQHLEVPVEGAAWGLYDGHAGVALLHLQLAKEAGRAAQLDRALERIQLALEGLSADPSPPIGLFGGVAGVGFALSLCPGDHEALLDQLSAALRGAIDVQTWEGAVDLFDGLAGVALYFARRGDSGALDQLHSLLEQALPPLLVDEPTEPFGLGVAHGVAGVLPFLRGALQERSAAWLAAQLDRPGRARSRLRSKAGWCSGEPGVALAVGRADLALRLLEQPPEQWGLDDLALCHGIAGVAHALNRLWQHTGEPRFEAAARRLLLTVLDRLHGEPSTWPLFRKEGATHGTHGLVEGQTGVALVLLAGASEVEPCWDQVFLMNRP